MSGGYVTYDQSEMGELRSQLRAIYDRLDELEAPSGTQIAGRPTPYSVQESESGFAVTGSFSTVAAGSFMVPRGFTKAVVTLSALAGLRNDQVSGWSSLGATARIGSVSSVAANQGIEAGQFGTATVGLSTVVQDLNDGDSISVECLMRFPSAHSLTVASVSATALFVR